MDDLGLEEPVDRLRQGIVVAVANAAHGWFNDEPFVRHWFKYNGECSAMRLKTTAYLEKTRIPITIDVGFGDALGNADYMLDYGFLLDYPSASVRAYSPRRSSRRSARRSSRSVSSMVG